MLHIIVVWPQFLEMYVFIVMFVEHMLFLNRHCPGFSTQHRTFMSAYSSPYRQVPHHVSYAPTSAQDSEIQSLSSQDTYLTDDTQSMTDSSV